MLPVDPKYRRPNLDDGYPKVYIKRGNLGQRAPRNFLPLGSRLEGRSISTAAPPPRKKKGQGPLPPRAVAMAVGAAAAVAVFFISSGLHLSINNSLSLSHHVHV